jgi:hypothetical protein
VLAVKVAVVAVAGTVTEAGSVRTLAMAPEMATTAPPVGAALVKVTVQVVLALEAKLVATHCRDEIRPEAVAVREREADWEEPLREAVMVAV